MRKYHRKTSRGSWCPKDLESAMLAVKEDGMKVRKASKRFEVPFSTLRRRLKQNVLSAPVLGKLPVFTEDQERTLATNLKLMAKICFGLTMGQVRSAAFQFAEASNIKHNFNKEK